MSSEASDDQPRKRVRDPDAHRAGILAAARAVFRERGFGGATMREIEQRAGVGHGMARLHYTSKERLFAAAVMADRPPVGDSILGDVEGLAERVARTYVERIESDGSADPFIAIIRSAGDTDVAKALLQAMRVEPTKAYAKVLDVPDVDRRSDLLGALMIGVAFSRCIVADGPLATMAPHDLIECLVPAIRAILFDSSNDDPPNRSPRRRNGTGGGAEPRQASTGRRLTGGR